MIFKWGYMWVLKQGNYFLYINQYIALKLQSYGQQVLLQSTFLLIKDSSRANANFIIASFFLQVVDLIDVTKAPKLWARNIYISGFASSGITVNVTLVFLLLITTACIDLPTLSPIIAITCHKCQPSAITKGSQMM